MVTRLGGLLITQFAFYPMYVAIKAWTFFIITILLIPIGIYLYFVVPETWNRPLNQIVEPWEHEDDEEKAPLLRSGSAKASEEFLGGERTNSANGQLSSNHGQLSSNHGQLSSANGHLSSNRDHC